MKNVHVFWQAFVLASIIFWAGIFLGISFEKNRIDKIEENYLDAQTNIFDFESSLEIINSFKIGCDSIKNKSIDFANEIYLEARKLEKYDDSNKITNNLISIHRRYDLLRSILWKEIIEAKKTCKKFPNTIVYLYEYDNPPLNTRSTQNVMSNNLLELKEKKGEEIILIPIAADSDIKNLEILMKFYGIEKTPSIIINEKTILTELKDLEEIEQYLN